LGAVSEEAQPAVPSVRPEELRELVERDGAQLVDVRADHEWDAGHLAGARHIRLDELPGRSGEIDRERPVVFYCRAGRRCATAAQAFAEAGYDARALEGGIAAGAEAGLQLEPRDGYVAESGEAAAALEARRRAGDPPSP
jgi:rhodanese-related sulfurtransferase